MNDTFVISKKASKVCVKQGATLLKLTPLAPFLKQVCPVADEKNGLIGVFPGMSQPKQSLSM